MRGSTPSVVVFDDAPFVTPEEEISPDPTEANDGPDYFISRNERRVANKKKKAKKKKHISNCQSGYHKAIMGSIILSKIGQVQRDTQDSLKKALLQNHPMADVVEAVTGEQLPTYQRNLLNQMQERAQNSETIVEEHEQPVNKSVPEDVLDGQFDLESEELEAVDTDDDFNQA